MRPPRSSPQPTTQLLLLLSLLLPATVLATTTTAGVVEQDRSAVYKQRVEVRVDGTTAYSATAVVEVSRYTSDTLLILTTRDPDNNATPLVSGRGSGRAVVVKSVRGHLTSLLHHVEETPASLNYKRSLASLLTPAHHTASLAYHTQADVLGTCEVRYERQGSTTITERDLTRCSHFTLERVLGGHHLPLLHLSVDLVGSTSRCQYRWRGAAGGVLEGVQCTETLLVAPRYSRASDLLNITITSSLTHTATAHFNPAAYEYLEEATETTDVTYQPVPYETEGDDKDVSELLKEVCSTEGEGRLTGGLLQKMSQLMHTVARSSTLDLPHFTTSCPANLRKMVAVAWAVVGGPRTLHFFFAQLAELARDPEDPMRLGDEFLFTLALRSLVDPGHHARHNLPHDFFLRRENQMVYEELVDYLLQQTPPPVSGVAALLEGLKQVSPQLYERLLRKCGPYLSPEAACDRGDHAEAVRLLRGVAGFTCRPQDYVASLRSCFANDNVDVLVAAMDTLACIDCSVQGVTELQKLGLNSPSDPEIRIAAYRGLVHCIPVQPQLLNTVAKTLNSEDVDYSPQVASYVWSHVQSVLSSDDPSLMNLRDLLTTADISQVPDPVWYDPRQHSRHMARTVHLDARTALTLAGDLVWGRYSPAPRALYLNLALHHDGHTHQMAQVVVRVTGLEAMLLSIPGVEYLMEASTVAAANLWSTLTRLARPSLRNKREISHDQIVEFIQQVMSRIPVGYRMGSSSLEVSLRLLGTHALHVRLANFRYSSPFSALADMLQPPLHAALAVFAPLLDNTLTMVTSSGVPVALRLTGVGGLQTLAHHNTRQNGGIFNFMASGGMWVGARLEVGQQRDAALNSHLLWSSDVPINADYEYEGEAIQVSFRVPDDWTGLLWQRRRDTSIVDNTLQLRVTQDCLGSGGPVELCLETCTSENEALGGSVRGPDGWLAPYAHSVTLHLPPGEPIIITTSNPNMGGEAQVTQMMVEAGGDRFDASLVIQQLPSLSVIFTFNSLHHSYYFKGFAGSRERITQMAGLEVGLDRSRYGVRLQLSTPHLERQRVWSPSAFITTPEGGEKEVMRGFISWKEEQEDVFSAELSLSTMGPVTDYINLRIASEVGVTISLEDGSLMMVEVRSLTVAWPGTFRVDTSGRLFLTLSPHGHGLLKVGWGEDDGEIEVSMAVGPVVTFLIDQQQQQQLEGTRGTSFKFSISGRHREQPGVTEGSVALILDAGRVDVDLNFVLAEKGGFSFSHTYSGPGDIKTSARVAYEPLDVWWGCEHELLVREDQLRHWLNVSWSNNPLDKVSSLVQVASHSYTHLDVLLRVLVMWPGQVVEVQETLAKALGGSYKNKLMVRLEPGNTFNMDTIIITRSDNEIFSYGLSNTFKLLTWVSPVSVVGTFNCVGKGQCSVVVTAEQGGDELLDLHLQHTAAGGVSRTEANIVVTHWVDGSVSVDAAHMIGYYNVKGRAAVWRWGRLVEGRVEVDVASTDVAAAEVLVKELLEEGLQGPLTHAYNGTLTLNYQARTLHVRQEVVVSEEGRHQLWAGVVQGRAGHTVINNRHFVKATLMTPTGMYYTASGDVSSQVSGTESVVAALTLSAGAGPDASYLLSWDFDLQQPLSSDYREVVVREAVLMEEEEEEEGLLLLNLETLLRTNTPPTGEVKLNIKVKRTLQPPPEGDHQVTSYTSDVTTTDIRLITETVPELGRVHGILTRSVDTYSLNGRMWSGQRAVGVESYGVARNDSLKSSHLLTLVDPSFPWARLKLALDTDHIGTFPDNFQTSLSSKVSVGLVEEAGQVRALVQWTPATSAFNLALATYLTTLPGGNIFLKWSDGTVQGHVAWALIKGVAGVQWREGGRALEVALNYHNPGATLHHIDSTMTFTISQAPYPPVSLVLVGRVSINTHHHYVLNVDCRSEQDQYLVTGALVRPGASGSLRVQLRRGGDTYGFLGVIVLDGFSLQVTGAFTAVDAGEEVSVTLNSSLLKDPRGYSIRVYRKKESGKMEIAAFYSQGGGSPNWFYSYRLLTEIQRDIKQKVRYLKAEDRFTYHLLQQILYDYTFVVVIVHNSFDEVELEAEFPDLWPEVKVTGTVVKGKDSQLDLIVKTPSLTHLAYGRLIFSSADWWSAHSGSLIYNQEERLGATNAFKMELEASKWNSDRQKYKFFLQKTHREVADVSSAMETLFEYPYEIYDLSDIPGYSYDDPAKPASLTTFDATVDVSRDPGATEYKVLWQTDETRSEARALLEKDPSGGGALLRYHRQVKGVPSTPQVEYQLKGNYRRIDTELTISCTLDQSSLTRPRAIIFLHSEAEGYTELLLDLFQEEADQVILVITYLPQNFRFRIGQFGNTFLQTGYQMETDDQGDTLHRIQVESSGRTVEVWAGWMLMEQRTCTRGGLVVETPTLAPTYHLLMICPAPSPELTLQVLGVEEHEGPYLRLGQISGPGGVGAQVGSGRLRPLDTPPALTLTADVEDEVMEVLLDWQTRSLAQFKDEFNSRWTSLAGAVRGLSSTRVRVEGALGLWPLLNDTQQLLHEALHLTTSASTYMMVKVMEEGPVDVGELLEVSGNVMREHLDPLLEVCVEALDDALGAVYNSLEEAIEAVDDLVQNIVEEVTGAYDTMEEDVTEVVEGVMETLTNTLGPPLLHLQAAFNALSYNDDQSLYALVSRIMGDVRKRVGRRHGISGFFVTQLLTRLERLLVRTARWDELRARGSELLHHARNITTISFVMPHATALRLRVAMPRRLGRDLRVAGKWFLEEGGLRLLTETESWFITHWSRFRYLLTWHVRGEAVVFGWEQAITWDGRQVTPLLTDSCHHLLVLLIHARIPTAVTIHMEDLSTHPREVLTFFSGTDVVTIDSDLKMTYNWKHIRRPLLEVGELQLRLWQGRASITSDVGLSLECEHQQGLCRLAVSGDHFAATAGLLGVFDFDNYTDFMTSGWDVAATEEEWARSWRVSSSEQCSSQLPESHIPASHGHYCTDIFHASTSPFRSCFPSVAAAPYLETCRAGWECAAEAAYLHSCRRHYHDLHTNLSSCSTCSGKEGEEEEGTEGLPLEVVIITDFECFQDLHDLISALVKDNARDHRVVVRYIGRGSPPYGPFDDVAETVVDNGTPPLDAALNAATLDFSERALKSIVVFDCDHPRCSVSSTAAKIVKLRETLLALGVQLHVVTMDGLTVLNPQSLTRKATRQLIGVDGHTAYLLSHARKRKVRGKRTIRNFITTPIGNTCTDLAIETDGSVFSLQNLKLSRKYHRRIFQQLLALRVEEGREAEYLKCRRCVCGGPCTLCDPPTPLMYTSSSRDEEEEEEDYDDEEEEEQPVRRKNKKRQRSRWPR